jgi:hypothetical protein
MFLTPVVISLFEDRATTTITDGTHARGLVLSLEQDALIAELLTEFLP